MTNQFSAAVSQVLAFSREEANRLASRTVGPEHLLLGILRDNSPRLRSLFQRQGVDLQAMKQELEDRVREESTDQPLTARELVLNERASNILKLAVLEARIQHTQVVDTEHLLLAIMHDSITNGAKEILENNNMTYDETIKSLKSQALPTQNGIGLPDEEEEDETSVPGNGSQASSAGTQTATKQKNGKQGQE